jgi:hypothetical protein
MYLYPKCALLKTWVLYQNKKKKIGICLFKIKNMGFVPKTKRCSDKLASK